MSFRSTRLVANYGDDSELHFLPGDNSYVWMRPVKNRDKKIRFREMMISAGSDDEALSKVSKIAADEYETRMLTGVVSKW